MHFLDFCCLVSEFLLGEKNCDYFANFTILIPSRHFDTLPIPITHVGPPLRVKVK